MPACLRPCRCATFAGNASGKAMGCVRSAGSRTPLSLGKGFHSPRKSERAINMPAILYPFSFFGGGAGISPHCSITSFSLCCIHCCNRVSIPGSTHSQSYPLPEGARTQGEGLKEGAGSIGVHVFVSWACWWR